MPVDEVGSGLIPSINSALVIKIFLILFLVFYVVFAFILFRQIQLMGRTLPTPTVPLLRFVATVHIGVSVALLFAIIGTF